ncbi:MAG: tyrosine-type recombinase/integrase [Gemmataceae bacterium]
MPALGFGTGKVVCPPDRRRPGISPLHPRPNAGWRSTACSPTAADLERFALWADPGLADYLFPTLRELSNYVSFLREQEGLAPASVARHLVALKMFCLRLEERTTQTSVDLLSAPALWQRIPQVLSPENVTKLLEAPQPLDRYFVRDRALLETLYATGSRASEVVGLRLGDLHLQAGFCKCFGKGSKQRIVPLGRIAVNALADVPRPTAAGADPRHVGLSVGVRQSRRQAADARAVGAGEEVRQAGGLHSKVSPHTLQQLRHPPARRRRRRAVQELLDHSSIRTTQQYPRRPRSPPRHRSSTHAGTRNSNNPKRRQPDAASPTRARMEKPSLAARLW